MLTLGLTATAVACAGVGVAAAVLASHPPRRVGAATALAAVAVAGVAGVGVTVVLAAFGVIDGFGLLHLAYLGVTVTVPLLAAGVGVLAWRRPAARWLAPVVVLGLLPAPVGVYATHIEPSRLRVDRHDVVLAPERAGDDEVRVAVLADLQTNGVGDHERRAVDEILAAEPDVILLPGDLFQGTDAELDGQLAAMRALLGRLAAPHGVFYVRGDVDGQAGGAADRILEGLDIELLVDEVTEVEVGDRTLRIGGTALAFDSDGADAVRTDLGATPAGGAITILMSHRPDTVLALPDDARVDLTVAGHTHGGQVVVPGVGPLLTLSEVPRDVARGGLHRVDGNPIYLSPGVGLERGQAPQVRFLSRPAVGVLTLRDAA